MPKYTVLPARLPEIFFNMYVTYVNSRSASSVARIDTFHHYSKL